MDEHNPRPAAGGQPPSQPDAFGALLQAVAAPPDADGAVSPEPQVRHGWRRWIPARLVATRRRRLLLVLVLAVTTAVAVLAVFGWYLGARKPISQLPGLNREKPPHYLFSIYGTTQPLGVAVAPGGDRVYVAESGGKRLVHVYERSGKEVSTLRPPDATGSATGTGTASGHLPVYVAVDPLTEDVYVSDRTTASIYVYHRDGSYLRAITPPAGAAGWAPLGLAFDSKGRLYVTDVRSGGSHRVVVLGRDGSLVTTLSPTGGLRFPNGISVDARGVVEVSDSNNARVVLFGPDGKVLGRLVSGGDSSLGLPRGTAVDDQRRLYVVDATNHVVRTYRIPDAPSAMPVSIGSFGAEGTVEGTFEYPNGIAADSRARIYVTDRENNRVQVWGY